MNTLMMEGLLGASAGIRLSGTPMRVYRQASAEGDTEKMERALGYTGECAEQAVNCQEKLDKGMKAEAEAARETEKLEREAAIEKRRQERRRAEEGAKPGRPPETDSVQISDAARAAQKSRLDESAEPAALEPVIYTPTGACAAALEASEPTISVTA